MRALESHSLATKMKRNMESPIRNAKILFAQEFDGGFMDYFISTQPWPSGILPDHIRSVYKVIPLNLKPCWFFYFVCLFIFVEGILNFFFIFTHTCNWTSAWVQTRLLWVDSGALLLSRQGHSQGWLAGIHSIPLSRFLTKVHFLLHYNLMLEEGRSRLHIWTLVCGKLI